MKTIDYKALLDHDFAFIKAFIADTPGAETIRLASCEEAHRVEYRDDGRADWKEGNLLPIQGATDLTISDDDFDARLMMTLLRAYANLDDAPIVVGIRGEGHRVIEPGVVCRTPYRDCRGDESVFGASWFRGSKKA